MFKVSVMYPYEKGAKFDFDYYRPKHMNLVHKHLKPYGLIKTDVDRGISGGCRDSGRWPANDKKPG